MQPIRLQRRRSKGWRKPANAVIVDRTSRWGNPFETADEFESVLILLMKGSLYFDELCLLEFVFSKEGIFRMQHIAEHIHELTGRDLVCWCGPDKKCHADVLIKLANQR